MVSQVLKQSYTIPCASVFRDAANELAQRAGVNVADLARSVTLMMPKEEIEAFPDPGPPKPGDREDVVLKSGSAKGRPWRRKPRLQVRMAPGFAIETIRKSLGLALAMDQGERTVRIDCEDAAAKQSEAETALIREAREELERLRTMVSALSFDPLPGGVKNRADALHVLGFPPAAIPDQETLRARFRILATVHHPDGGHGDHDRMSQLNAAMDNLRRGAA